MKSTALHLVSKQCLQEKQIDFKGDTEKSWQMC